MFRPSRVRALGLFSLLAAAGCQDYNFNPVGHCLIQPGTQRVSLSKVSTADVLFVVDDSGSMAGEQQKLAANFDAFISNLNQTNVDRVNNGQVAIDFHLAVTTTSVFHNEPAGALCRSDCPSGGGSPVCCTMSGNTPTGPLRTVQKCTGPGAACQSGSCRNDCRTFVGEYVCCDDITKVPSATQVTSCSAVGEPCGDLRTHYRFAPSCTAGSAAGQNERPYPQGSFIGLNTNPRVIHFDKEMYTCATPPCTGPTGPNLQGYTAAQLQTFFTQNVVVGTCGSGEEQGLQAAKLAVEKALAGQQLDTVNGSGAPASIPASWLHKDSKLVLVFVGDEDDCSSPQDPNLGIVLSVLPTGEDTCVADTAKPPEQQKQFAVSSIVNSIASSLASLPGDHPMGAAFIVSARSGGQDVCQDESCVPDICCDTACTGNGTCNSNVCGGQAKGTRLLEAAGQLRGKGADVVAGSVCDPNFNLILNRIAEIVKPPSGLLLPSTPATEQITVLRIAGPDGKTRKTCRGPAPADLTARQAKGLDALPAGSTATPPYDWWFTLSREQVTEAQQDPTGISRFVYINHDTRSCEAGPGDTYSADYLGRLPENGCSGATAEEADASCASALGGTAREWTCFNGTNAQGYCTIPTGGPVVGTCICGQRYTPPPASATCTPGEANIPGGGNCPWGCTPGDEYCPTLPLICPATP